MYICVVCLAKLLLLLHNKCHSKCHVQKTSLVFFAYNKIIHKFLIDNFFNTSYKHMNIMNVLNN